MTDDCKWFVYSNFIAATYFTDPHPSAEYVEELLKAMNVSLETIEADMQATYDKAVYDEAVYDEASGTERPAARETSKGS